MTDDRVYLSPPDVGEAERELLLDAFDSNWIAPLGPHVDAFEAEIAARVDVGHAAALSSGTGALELALRLLGVGAGDRVLVSSLTFIASIGPAVHVGAVPVLVDSETQTWNMDPDLVADELERSAAAGQLPAAIVAVDVYGQCADYDRLEPLCQQYGVPLIEDAAEALGASWSNRPAGSFGTCAVLSFNGNKIITTSGGGMLVSQDANLVRGARHLASQARKPVAHYEHDIVGFNLRMSNLCAALGRGQLQSLDRKVARRREIFSRYERSLGELGGITFMPEPPASESTRWLTVMLLDPGAIRATPDDVRLALEQANIEARRAWMPMHRQPVFKGASVVGGKIADRIFDQGLCLPSGSSLTDADVDRVIEITLEAMGAI